MVYIDDMSRQVTIIPFRIANSLYRAFMLEGHIIVYADMYWYVFLHVGGDSPKDIDDLDFDGVMYVSEDLHDAIDTVLEVVAD